MRRRYPSRVCLWCCLDCNVRLLTHSVGVSVKVYGWWLARNASNDDNVTLVMDGASQSVYNQNTKGFVFEETWNLEDMPPSALFYCQDDLSPGQHTLKIINYGRIIGVDGFQFGIQSLPTTSETLTMSQTQSASTASNPALPGSIPVGADTPSVGVNPSTEPSKSSMQTSTSSSSGERRHGPIV